MAKIGTRAGREDVKAAKSKYDTFNQDPAFRVDMADALETCNAQTLARALARIVGSGDAVLLSLTADGGALCITLLEEDNRRKLYCTSPRNLEETLERLLL